MNILEVIEEVGLLADWSNGPGWASVAKHRAGFEICWNPHGRHLTVAGPIDHFEGLRPDLFPSLPKYSAGWLDLEPWLESLKERIKEGKVLPEVFQFREVWSWNEVGTALVIAVLEVPLEGWEPACPEGHEWAPKEWGVETFRTYRCTIVCRRCLCRKRGSPFYLKRKEAKDLLKVAPAWQR